jgi:DNA-binding GntR family transcriptional regulator
MPTASLSQAAYDRILDAIVYGPLDLGQPLSEAALARALGMSKAPVRAAIHELRVKGLVRIVPHSGTYVFSPTRQEIEQLCDFRTLLEAEALRLAMRYQPEALVAALGNVLARMEAASKVDERAGRRLDSEFHHAFFAYCGNRYLVDAYQTIALRVEALRYRFMQTTVFRQKANHEHQALSELLGQGRIRRAVAMLEAHIARTREFQSSAPWPSGRARRSDYRFGSERAMLGLSATHRLDTAAESSAPGRISRS